MAQLSGNKIKDSFLGLLKTDNNAAITGEIGITDGAGNTAGIALNPGNSEFKLVGNGSSFPRLTLTDSSVNPTWVPFQAEDGANNIKGQLNLDQYGSFNMITAFATTDPELVVQNLADNDAKIAINAYNSVNNSDNWFTAYNERITAGSYDGVSQNLTLTKPSGTDIIVNIPSGGGAGVDSLNTLTGGLSLSAGTGISISDNGSDTITVTATGGGGGGTLPAMQINELPPFKGVFLGGTSYNASPAGLTNYTTQNGETSGNSQAVLGYIPIAEGAELTSIIFEIKTTLATTGSLKVGIYGCDGTTTSTAGTPYLTANTLLKDLGTVDATTTGVKQIDFTGASAFTMPSGQQYGGVWIVIGGDGTLDGNTVLSAWSENIHDGNGGRYLSGNYYRATSKVLTGWNGTFADYTSSSYTSNTAKPLFLLYA